MDSPQAWFSVIGTVLGIAALVVHRVGHVNHRVALDDINDYLRTLHSELDAQGVKVPPPPTAPVDIKKEG